MKSKIILLLIISAVTTLSFTFYSKQKNDVKLNKTTAVQKDNDAPAGGFVSEDKF